MKHSKLGITSCVIAVATFLMMALLIGASYFISNATADHQQIGAVWIVTDVSTLFLPIPVHFIGLILGVVALFLQNRRKLFPIIGALLNLILGIGSVWPWLYLISHIL